MAKSSTVRQERTQREEGPAPARSAASQPVSVPLDRLIHERIRLGIVSALAVNRTLTFNELKALLKTTDGNLSVHARKLEELTGRNHAIARRSAHMKLGIQGKQCGRGVRWMNDVAGSAAENRVELVLARSRETLVPAVLETRKSVAIIPAPGPLTLIVWRRCLRR